MKIVVLDGHVLNPGDLSWDSLRKLGEVKIYERSKPEGSGRAYRRCRGNPYQQGKDYGRAAGACVRICAISELPLRATIR